MDTLKLCPAYAVETLEKSWNPMHMAKEGLSLIYIYTCPLIDSNSNLIYTLCRMQTWVDGDGIMSLNIIDHWQVADKMFSIVCPEDERKNHHSPQEEEPYPLDNSLSQILDNPYLLDNQPPELEELWNKII